MKMKTFKMLLLFAAVFIISSCNHYLDVKPNLNLATPTTVKGLQALLDNERYVVQSYPASGDLASDYFYLEYPDWAGLGMQYHRGTYIWNEQGALMTEWTSQFERILTFNIILSEVVNAELGEASEQDRMRVKGTAHFFRGWSYLQLAQIFAPHYEPGVNDDDWGLPLRTEPDINMPSKRNTLSETYGLILDDFRKAAGYLPTTLITPTRPSKATVFAALARTYLILGDWEASYQYADSCLQLQGQLIDYKSIDYHNSFPFHLFNKEVLLHTTILSASASFSPARAKVDSVLYNSYHDYDLRRYANYFQNADETYSFKGSYTGEGNSNRSALLFSGLAIDEVYLSKAESLVRLGKDIDALETLNTLLVNRHDIGWQPYLVTDYDSESLLRLILEEREKSLAFRAGIRWPDLRRLNTDERFAKTLVRDLDGERYTLPPNDLRYTFLIPTEIIQLTGMPQNKR